MEHHTPSAPAASAPAATAIKVEENGLTNIKQEEDGINEESCTPANHAVSTAAIKVEELSSLLPIKQEAAAPEEGNATDYSHVEGGVGNHPTAATFATPRATAADATSEKRIRSRLPPQYSTTVRSSTSATTAPGIVHDEDEEIAIGKPILVSTQGNFPSLGSQLGPLFCLGRLGKGTFCSIHKCIQLHYYDAPSPQQTRHRIAAAKVELDTFQNSGVLDGEAVVLQHLDVSLPAGTVPKYMGYYKTVAPSMNLDGTKQQQQPSSQSQSQPPQYGNAACSAIVMEYLQGEDMHQLRDRVVFGRPSRRIALPDAVYLTADVMLPLLQRMHQVGIVHRDVKPSNVVRCGNTGTDRRFCMVDFGLSKSLVVPHDSSLADYDHAWQGTSWIRPPPSGPGGSSSINHNAAAAAAASMAATINSQSVWDPPHANGNGVTNHHPDHDTNQPPVMAYLRKERPTAEFRGTSMYASLRVHQLKDYCPRDDMWSLLYVFCDLASGGLPWMSHAANRDREACQKLKEKVHGEVNSTGSSSGGNANGTPPVPDETHQLLMGDLHHLAKFKRDHARNKSASGGDANEVPLPEPLALSKDAGKVQLLRTAFAHLATLEFWDIPDYNLIQSCIKGFLDGPPSTLDDPIAPISWEHFPSKPSNKYRRSESASSSVAAGLFRKRVPTWNLSTADVSDNDWDEDLFDETESSSSNEGEAGSSHPLEGDDADMARLPLEFRYRVAQMEYNTFHSNVCPTHLALRDFMNVALPLLYGEWDSRTFEKGNHRTNSDGFRRDLYLKLLDKCLKCAEHFDHFTDSSWLYEKDSATAPPPDAAAPALKRRKMVTSTSACCTRGNDLVAVANVVIGLENSKAIEEKKNLAPPPRLSFGSGFGMM